MCRVGMATHFGTNTDMGTVTMGCKKGCNGQICCSVVKGYTVFNYCSHQMRGKLPIGLPVIPSCLLRGTHFDILWKSTKRSGANSLVGTFVATKHLTLEP